jgi:hypothetical protein
LFEELRLPCLSVFYFLLQITKQGSCSFFNSKV